MIRLHAARWRKERGASSVEYALLMSLIAVVIISGVLIFGNSTGGLFTDGCDALAQARGGTC